MAEKKKDAGSKPEPVLKLNFLSHGTLDVKNLQESRRFYEEFLGLECVRTSDISMMIRLGGVHIYAVVEVGDKSIKLPFLNHNGLDVATDGEVDECHRIIGEQADKWGLHGITKPRLQHGTYSFYFWDMDDNCWEILQNPEGGYTWLFERGDLEGRGHFVKQFDRPDQ